MDRNPWQFLQTLQDVFSGFKEMDIQLHATKNLDRFYKVHEPHIFLYKKHVMDPAVVAVDPYKGWKLVPAPSTLSSDKESRVLDHFGKKMHTSTTLTFRAIDCQTYVSKFQIVFQDQMKEKTEEVSEQAPREKLLEIT